MILVKNTSDLKGFLQKSQGPISFVPTMGALHRGHLALMETARKHSSTTVCSIFVNPTQFNDPKDFAKYPITLEKDIELLEHSGTDILFLPSVSTLYPLVTSNLENYELGYLETVLEGSSRPGHFQGVCQVMFRLLTAVGPVKLFMGQKDYQQCMVVKRLLEITRLPAMLYTCDTVRESDGLAMSSRNKRLSSQERQNATAISKALNYAKEHLGKQSLQEIRTTATEILESSQFKIDYIEFADAGTLELRENWDGQQSLVLLIAAFHGEVRLIDNMILHH